MTDPMTDPKTAPLSQAISLPHAIPSAIPNAIPSAIIEQFFTPGLAQYAYLIASGDEAVVLDPMRGDSRYADFAAAHGLRITRVLETHLHADFASGATALAAKLGAELTLSAYAAGERFAYNMPHTPLQDGERIRVGQLELEALHTPGHTPEHMSYALYDLAQAPETPQALFSGDFIFSGSLGRPDLLGVEAEIGLAQALYRSLHQRIAHLPDSVRIYPGHGAGSLCGAGIGTQSETTLGQERLTNPLYRLSEEDFVHEILAIVPPMPAYYPRMKDLNSIGATAMETLPQPHALTAAEVAALDLSQNLLVDLRSIESFAAGHIPGAINLGAGASLPVWAGWLLDPKTPLLLITEDGCDDPASRLALARVGLERVTGYLQGGMTAWRAAQRPEKQVGLRSASQVESERSKNEGSRAEKSKSLLLDVRHDKEWKADHIDGAQHIPLDHLREQLPSLPKDRPIVAICQGGYRASIAASLLSGAGLNDVSLLVGGMNAWNQLKGVQTKAVCV